MSRPALRWLSVAFLLAGLIGPTVLAQRLESSVDGMVRPSEIEPKLETIAQAIRAGKWKHSLRLSRSLVETVVTRAWYGKELRQQITDLAFYQAVAAANLGRRDDAIWYWHTAQNLDPTIRQRDLSAYGKAKGLFLEFPLRAAGEVPAGFRVPQRLPSGPSLLGPRQPEMTSVPTVLNNTGAAAEGSGDFHVEVLIDQKGRIRHPVVKSDHLHPIVIYASLEWLRELPAFEPARFQGKVVDSLDSITVQFRVSRW